MIRKFFVDIYIDVVCIFIVGILVLYKWDGSVHQTTGIILAVIFFILWIISRIQLGSSFSIAPEASSLVTNGIYSKLRHPIYIFSSLCLLGLIIAINNFYLYMPLVALFILQVIRARKENLVLRHKFGEQYEEYRKKTWF